MTETDIIIAPLGSGWGWRFAVIVDGDERDYGAGEAPTREEAESAARECRERWEHRHEA